jgi:hypothetical protein
MANKEEKIKTLLLDDRFVDWINNPESPYAGYWLQWIEESADNEELADAAREFLTELHLAELTMEASTGETVVDKMWADVSRSIMEEPAGRRRSRRGVRSWYWMAAAGIIGILLFVGMTFFREQPRQLASAKKKAGQFAAKSFFSPEVVRYNGSEGGELFFLPDGSKVTLAKGGRIAYDRLMNGKSREVTLSGEAFFDVAKNPAKPFYIYTRNMIIKVLGTSFRVIASEKKESVVVKTGKVSVFLKDQDLEQSGATILLPKQVCTYSRSGGELVMTPYTGRSDIEMSTTGRNGHNFEDAPVDSVLGALEKMYAIPVHYEQGVFAHCFITISLGDESLEEQLEAITRTIGASFSISDYGITVDGRGCKD